MSTHRISYTSCESNRHQRDFTPVLTAPSADLEVTVALLVQIDKLVQLIESPVFTCESLSAGLCGTRLIPITIRRPETPTPRAGEIPIPIQVFVWFVDVAATKFGIRLSEEQA